MVIFTGTLMSFRKGPTWTESQILSWQLQESRTFSYTLFNKIQHLRKCLDFQSFHEGIVSSAAMKTKSLILCPQARCHCNRMWGRQRDEKCWQTTACQQSTQITEFILDSFDFLLKQIFFFYFHDVIHIEEKNNITNAYRKITLNLSSWILKKETEQGKKNNKIAWKH